MEGIHGVALYMSAWIEITHVAAWVFSKSVALYMSAWIEIERNKLQAFFAAGRTLYECVDWNIQKALRQRRKTVALYMSAWIEIFPQFFIALFIIVALYMSAWIEMSLIDSAAFSASSHSIWVRGLKYQSCTCPHAGRVSHSIWVRGLKSEAPEPEDEEEDVALYMSAWIEIVIPKHVQVELRVALYMSAWIEIYNQSASCIVDMSHSIWVRGLK